MERYYTIQNDNILIAENKMILKQFYENVFELPLDYEDGKYIIINQKLVLNPNWDEEHQQRKRQKRNQEIDYKIKELREMALADLLKDNSKNIEIYNAVINSLMESKFNIALS